MARFVAAPGLEEKVAAMIAPAISRIAETVAEGARAAAPDDKTWMCLAPDTPVRAAGAYAAARRHYVGPLVRITTASGRSFAATPEHHILTGRGWVQAQALHQGDYLFQVHDIPPARTPHIQNRPTGIGEHIDALMEAAPRQVRTMRRPVNLNGQPGDSEVEVVAPNGHLLSHLETGLNQDFKEFAFTDANILAAVAMFGAGHCLDHRLRAWHPAIAGQPGRVLCSPNGALRRGTDLPCRALTPALHAVLTQDAPNYRLGAAMFLGDRPQRATGQVGAHHLGLIDIRTLGDQVRGSARAVNLRERFWPLKVAARRRRNIEQYAFASELSLDGDPMHSDGCGDLRRGFTGLVAPDDIADIEVRATYSGHVYDLSTQGQWFLADGLIIHNSAADDRVRPEHRASHGQAVPSNLRFTLESPQYDMQHHGAGPHQLARAPRDPDLTPGLKIGCRCVAVLTEGLARDITAHPAQVTGPLVSARVTCEHHLAVTAEFGTATDQGARYMDAGLREGARRLRR